VRWRRPPFEVHAHHAAVSHDGRWLIAADRERHAFMLFDCSTGELKYRVPSDAEVNALAVADDGKSFFTGDVNGSVSVWSLEHGQKLFDLAHFASQVEALCSTEHSVLAAVVEQLDDLKVRRTYEFSTD
jgi:WD40 repeat protein